MVTIRDVAKLAGVSPATASQALNGRPRVNSGTRERVEAAATKLRYAPNLNGRRLARRRAESLVIVQGGNMSTMFSDSFYRVVLGGVAEAAQAHGYSLVINPALRAGTRRGEILRALGHGAADGALVLGVVEEDLLLALRDRGLPVVMVDNHLPGSDLPAVLPDYRDGARLATAHLLGLGHRRVALLGAAVAYPFGWETHEGYGEALAAEGVPYDPGLIVRCEIGGEAAAQATHALLALPRRPTALFAVTDLMAVGAMRAVRERGLRVPDDLAVVGMDDIELSAYTEPPLTTVRVAKEAMGRLAAERLVALIEGDGSVRGVVSVAGELVVRQSTGRVETRGEVP